MEALPNGIEAVHVMLDFTELCSFFCCLNKSSDIAIVVTLVSDLESTSGLDVWL